MVLDRAALERAHPHEQAHTSTGVSNTKLAIWVFLSSECLFFGAFISTYLLYRGRDVVGSTPHDVYDIPFTSVTSFILLMSSLTMVLALAAIERGDMRRTRLWLLATAAFGMLFISGQIFEFTEFVRQGVSLSTNAPSSSFFVLTSIHGFHVVVGIIMLLILFAFALGNRLSHDHSETVEVVGLYWHFVDIVWIVIFVVVYLIPQ
jgi:heme/copper-type cytochrome/quinol oxidase subunit 3